MKCILDIETLSLGSIRTTGIGNTPIIAIGLYLIEKNEEKIFTINTYYYGKCKEEKGIIDLAEACLIHETIKQLREWCVETIIGYNIINFDLPYLALRVDRLSHKKKKKGVDLKKEFTLLFGKVQRIIDLHGIALEKLNYEGLVSLREVYRELTGETISKNDDVYIKGAAELILDKPKKIKKHLSGDLKMMLEVYNHLIG